MTNRHVAEKFANRDRSFKCSMVPDDAGKIKVTATFRKFACSVVDPLTFPVTEVLYIDPVENGPDDVALLKLDARPGVLPPPLHLVGEKPKDLRNLDVYVPGFPTQDDSGLVDSATLTTFFNGVFGVKRLSPGRIIAAKDMTHLRHDCSTL